MFYFRKNRFYIFCFLLAFGIIVSSGLAIEKTGLLKNLTDDELLNVVQKQTLRYFWEFAHPKCFMAPERDTAPDMVTSGGTGFGLMCWIVGVERGWIDRSEVLHRCHVMVDFLEKADRFHGAWPHWIDGKTGKPISFSKYDDGGDIVETSYLVQGLLTIKNYFDSDNDSERELRRKIDYLWHQVEWDWYTRGEKQLYWHWSANHAWKMNHAIKGYNECLITYILAASSPSHPIDSDAYHKGWTSAPEFYNGKTYYRRYKLSLGYDFGGPLFFTHYSFLGIDPHKLHDRYADYMQQNINHSMINYHYCALNPKRYKGYSKECWGLTASDNYEGYSAHSPTNDLGVITPSAAISSIPYTPLQSMRAIRYFYEQLGEKIWGEYGFVDSFSIHRNWYATSSLAIDQGPEIIMIENYRTGLLWKLLMQDCDIQRGLNNLGFVNP
ncbi:MAG: beta-glucosidase [Candidatus Riflebacteria bacterium]|nr:beta-glucosidase [Candidatus Riflebacteria bacterium]